MQAPPPEAVNDSQTGSIDLAYPSSSRSIIIPQEVNNEESVYSVVDCPSEKQISRPNSSQGLQSLQSSIKLESPDIVTEFENQQMITDDQKPTIVCVDICQVTDSECNNTALLEKNQIDVQEY